MYNEKYIEEMVSMLAILSQMNLILEKFCLDKKSDIKNQYCILRNRILAWLEVCNIKPEIDDQHYFKN